MSSVNRNFCSIAAAVFADNLTGWHDCKNIELQYELRVSTFKNIYQPADFGLLLIQPSLLKTELLNIFYEVQKHCNKKIAHFCFQTNWISAAAMPSSANILWSLKSFHNLSSNELYDLLQMRQQVFVVEQTCPYRDLDGIDQLSLHLTGRKNNIIVAYSRIIPPGILYPEPSIGRVASHIEVRGTGIGRELFKRSMDECVKLFGHQPVKITAQSYLKNFYESFGFEMQGESFLEDNIPHIYMICP